MHDVVLAIDDERAFLDIIRAVARSANFAVTVTTDPPNRAAASCVDRLVRAIRWPSSPKLDTFTTTY